MAKIHRLSSDSKPMNKPDLLTRICALCLAPFCGVAMALCLPVAILSCLFLWASWSCIAILCGSKPLKLSFSLHD